MSDMLRATVLGALVLMPSSTAAQKPNFSGDWHLESATTAGGARGAGASKLSGERTITTNTAGGAAFNCGRECTIIQKGQTLTIEKALLASSSTPAPVVTLQLDGQQAPVIDSFSPNRTILAAAKWKGSEIEIVSSTGSLTFTQLLSAEGAQLVVVTSLDRAGSSPVTFRYRQK